MKPPGLLLIKFCRMLNFTLLVLNTCVILIDLPLFNWDLIQMKDIQKQLKGYIEYREYSYNIFPFFVIMLESFFNRFVFMYQDIIFPVILLCLYGGIYFIAYYLVGYNHELVADPFALPKKIYVIVICVITCILALIFVRLKNGLHDKFVEKWGKGGKICYSIEVTTQNIEEDSDSSYSKLSD